MAYKRGWRRYKRYRKYRRFYRRYSRPYSRRYVNASSRSSIRMKCAITTTNVYLAGYGNDATDATMNVIEPYFKANEANPFSAANSPLYLAYCNLYEQVKILGVKVAMAVISPVGGADIPSLQIYTAWDRERGFNEDGWTAEQIKGASTNAISTCINNNVAKLSRSCWASDLMEKSTWIDTEMDVNDYNINLAWKHAGINCNMFHPGLWFYFNCPSLGQNKQVNVSVSVTYYMAFRNPKYGGAANADARLVDLGPRTLDAGGDVDGDGDMDVVMLDGHDADDDMPARASATLPDAPASRSVANLRAVQERDRLRPGPIRVHQPKNA